jgi:hypothetical protein
MELNGGSLDLWLYLGSSEIEKFNGDFAERGSTTQVAFHANSKKVGTRLPCDLRAYINSTRLTSSWQGG